MGTEYVKIRKIGQKLWPGEPFQYFKPDFPIRLIRKSGFFWAKDNLHKKICP